MLLYYMLSSRYFGRGRISVGSYGEVMWCVEIVGYVVGGSYREV